MHLIKDADHCKHKILCFFPKCHLEIEPPFMPREKAHIQRECRIRMHLATTDGWETKWRYIQIYSRIVLICMSSGGNQVGAISLTISPNLNISLGVRSDTFLTND